MASKEVLEALERLHRELEKLEPAIKHVETAQEVTQIVKGIPQKHLELMSEVKNNDAKNKEDLKNLFSKELGGLTEENKKLQKATGEIQQNVRAEQEALSKLRTTMQEFHERVAKIHFPERLDKLDANVTNIMTGIQSIQNRLDNIERNIADRFKDLSDYQKETRGGLMTNLEQIKSTVLAALETSGKRQQTLFLITWCLIVLIGLLLFLIKKVFI